LLVDLAAYEYIKDSFHLEKWPSRKLEMRENEGLGTRNFLEHKLFLGVENNAIF